MLKGRSNRPVIARLTSLLLLLAAASVVDAASSTLYRCLGKQGETVFSSTRSGYTQCKPIRTFVDPAASRSTAAAAPATASSAPAGPKVEFRTAAGSAQPPAVADPGGKAKVTRGAVYRYVKDGVTHYTNRRPAGGRAEVLFSYTETCFACSARPGYDFSSVALNTTAFSEEVRLAAQTTGLEEAFVRAIIHAESAFNPNALSNKGAQGLMQLIPATAARFGVLEPFTPAENIRGGTEYLAWLLKRFKGDTRLAAAAYNAGEGAVDRYSGVPPYQETQRYIERVAILHERYRGALASATPVAAAASASSAE